MKLKWKQIPGDKISAALSTAGHYVISHRPEHFTVSYRPPRQHYYVGTATTLKQAKELAETHAEGSKAMPNMNLAVIVISRDGQYVVPPIAVIGDRTSTILEGKYKGKTVGERAEEIFIQACKEHAGLRADWTPENNIEDENAPNFDDGFFQSSTGLNTVAITWPSIDQ